MFADVTNLMSIARNEIFGPVLVMIPFDTEEEAVAIANDTPYGLAAYIQTGDPERAKRVARKLRAGSSISTATARTGMCRSVVTSSPAMAANMANSAWKTFWN